MHYQWDVCAVLVENSRKRFETRKPTCWDFSPQRYPECLEDQARLTAFCYSCDEKHIWRMWDMDRQVQEARKCPLSVWSEQYRLSVQLTAHTSLFLFFFFSLYTGIHKFYFLLIFFGVYLLYNIVLFFAVQQSESVIHIHISILF